MLSDHLANALGLHLTGTGYTYDGPIELALFSTPPSPSGGGLEVTGDEYARQTVTFAAAADRRIESSATVTFTELDSTGKRTVWGWALYDQTDNMLACVSIPPVEVAAGQPVVFPAGRIRVDGVGPELSDAAAEAWLDQVFRDVTWNLSSIQLYMGLTVDGTEVSGGDYARAEAMFSVDGRIMELNAPVEFPVVHDTNAQAVDGVRLFDDVTGGTLLGASGLTSAEVPANEAFHMIDWKIRL